jgi:hypothetical protein
MTNMKIPAEGEVLRETLDALEMPRHGLRKWFAHDRRFCEAHGGAKVYPELLGLLDECNALLDEMTPVEKK